MKIWFPLIEAGSGTDVFTRRLALELENVGINVSITLFDRKFEFFPQLLRKYTPPVNTTVIHTNSWNGFAFRRSGCRLIVTRHLDVFDSKYLPYKSINQRIHHNLVVRRFERQSFKFADTISVVSNELASTTKILTNKPLWTIPTWVNTNTFCPNINSSQTSDRPFRLLFVGNPTVRKGADLLKPIIDIFRNRFELVITSGLRSRNISKFKLAITQ